jgi:gliding motility-associated-like protein
MKPIFRILILVAFLSSSQFAKAQIEFIPNAGQWDAPYSFKVQGGGGQIFFGKDRIRFALNHPENADKIEKIRHGKNTTDGRLSFHVYDLVFHGANVNAGQNLSKHQKHYYNYFLGSDPGRWKTRITPGQNLDYVGLYPSIDAHFYGEGQSFKYDLIVHPTGNPEQIQIEYNGVHSIYLRDGKLQIVTSIGIIEEALPFCYQFDGGERKEIKCKYRLKNNRVSFEFPKGYNKELPLIIDPVVIFCSFTGSTADNWGFSATYDTLGNFYAGGIVVNDQPGVSTALTGGYPVTVGAFQTTYGGGNNIGAGLVPTDVAISKFNPAGNSLLYATYFGGLGNEQPHSMVVDKQGNLVVSGRTNSTEASFPLSPGCYDNTFNGVYDIFVAKFNPAGSALLGSTYVGGSGQDGVNIAPDNFTITGIKHNYGDDARSEVITDSSDNIIVTASSSSTNFPTIQPLQASLGGLQDGVVFQLNPNCTNLLWSTYLGGTNNDAGYVLAIDKNNQSTLFVGGGTESANFPTTPGTLHPTAQGGIDGFLLKFDLTTKALLAGTYIGTAAYDQVYGIQTDDSNRVYIMGQSMGPFPTTAGVFSNPGSSQFAMSLNNNLSTIQHSTVFGSGTTAYTNISPVAFLVDKCGSVYVSGWGGPTGGNPGNTNGMPTTPGAIQTTTDGSDFYFIVFSKNFQNLLYGSYFGQNGGGGEHVDGGTSRFDPNGIIYQAICSACGGGTQNFPVTPGAYSTTKAPTTNCNLGAVKIDFQLQNPDAVASANGPLSGCVPFTVNFQNNSSSATNYVWNFGDGSPTSTATNPSHTYTTAGVYTVSLVASNPNGCTASSDTTSLIITVIDDSIFASFTYIKIDSCGPYTANFTNTSTGNNGPISAGATYQWDFGDGTSFSGPNPPMHSFPNAGTFVVTLTITDPSACNSPSVYTQTIDFTSSIVTSAFVIPDSICMPANVNFIDQSTNATTWNWTFGDGNTSTQTNPTNTYGAPGTYTVFLVSGNPATCNKFDTSSQTLTIFPSPIADFTWAPNPPEPNTPNTFTNLSVGATRYLWDFGDGSTDTTKDPVHIYQKDGTYLVCLTAYNQYGCFDTVCKPVRGMVVPLVDVPTGFSPNGDGINDVVYVRGYGIDKMTFRIFNRWGEKVFESTDRSIGWDGRYKNVMQEMEVYGYTLSVTFFDGTKTFKKGNITLLK